MDHDMETIVKAIKASDDSYEASICLLTQLAAFQMRVGLIQNNQEAKALEQEMITWITQLRNALLS